MSCQRSWQVKLIFKCQVLTAEGNFDALRVSKYKSRSYLILTILLVTNGVAVRPSYTSRR